MEKDTAVDGFTLATQKRNNIFYRIHKNSDLHNSNNAKLNKEH